MTTLTIDELRSTLQQGKVHFEFTKKDGTLRKALGTLNEDLIPEEKKSKAETELIKFVEEFKSHFSGSVDYMSGVNDASYSLMRKLEESKNKSLNLRYYDLAKGAWRSVWKDTEKIIWYNSEY